MSEITGFTFDDVGVQVTETLKGEVVVIGQGDDCIETTVENMTEICTQWLSLHARDVLSWS